MFYKYFNSTATKQDFANVAQKIQKQIQQDFAKIAKKQNFAASQRINNNLQHLQDLRGVLDLLNQNNANRICDL